MITMKAIVPGTALVKNVKAVQKAWEAALKEEGAQISKLYKKTYHNWDNQPKETVTVKTSGNEWYAEVKLTGRIYWFVHEGIQTMYAILGPKDYWHARTQPGKLHSGAGTKILGLAKKPRKKYKPREFTETIIVAREKKFQKRMEEATRKGAQEALRGG